MHEVLNSELETALGRLRATLSSDAQISARACVASLSVEVRPGRPVSRRRAILFEIAASDSPYRVEMCCDLLESHPGGPEPGENLEAFEWSGPSAVVVAGTEDGRALGARARHLALDAEAEIGLWRQSGLGVGIPCVPAGVRLRLHVVVVEDVVREPPEDVRAWLGADADHGEILRAVSGG